LHSSADRTRLDRPVKFDPKEQPMATAVIVDAVRTPGGKRNGKLSGWHPADLASEVLTALIERNGLDPALVDDVIMGCVMQVGDQSINIGRNAVLAAGWPETVPATTIDRQCGSSQQSAHFAAQGVIAGAYDVVVAAGVEVMSTTPMGSSAIAGSFPFGPRMMERYAGVGGLVPQGISAEIIADKWGLTRDDLDAFGARSQQLAEQATAEGRFDNEIVPIKGRLKDRETGALVDLEEMVKSDEGIRPGTTVETLAKLKPAFKPDGKVTAGNSSQITDGAAAVLIMSEEKANALGLRPRARFHTFALAGVDPVTMLTGPIPATTRVLERAKLTIDDIDVVEINEAFASVVLAWEKEHHPDMAKVNPNGGAIALGHPLGCSGAKLMATLVNELERTGGRYGLQTMCEGGGMANATIIERLG
jgi:acetyl-CoA acyltransferase